ncbi:hypothetical protein BH10PSE19_BH10PSE19_21770 [soil metagenome]
MFTSETMRTRGQARVRADGAAQILLGLSRATPSSSSLSLPSAELFSSAPPPPPLSGLSTSSSSSSSSEARGLPRETRPVMEETLHVAPSPLQASPLLSSSASLSSTSTSAMLGSMTSGTSLSSLPQSSLGQPVPFAMPALEPMFPTPFLLVQHQLAMQQSYMQQLAAQQWAAAMYQQQLAMHSMALSSPVWPYGYASSSSATHPYMTLASSSSALHSPGPFPPLPVAEVKSVSVSASSSTPMVPRAPMAAVKVESIAPHHSSSDAKARVRSRARHRSAPLSSSHQDRDVSSPEDKKAKFLPDAVAKPEEKKEVAPLPPSKKSVRKFKGKKEKHQSKKRQRKEEVVAVAVAEEKAIRVKEVGCNYVTFVSHNANLERVSKKHPAYTNPHSKWSKLYEYHWKLPVYEGLSRRYVTVKNLESCSGGNKDMAAERVIHYRLSHDSHAYRRIRATGQSPWAVTAESVSQNFVSRRNMPDYREYQIDTLRVALVTKSGGGGGGGGEAGIEYCTAKHINLVNSGILAELGYRKAIKTETSPHVAKEAKSRDDDRDDKEDSDEETRGADAAFPRSTKGPSTPFRAPHALGVFGSSSSSSSSSGVSSVRAPQSVVPTARTGSALASLVLSAAPS